MKRNTINQTIVWLAVGIIGFLAYREFLQMNILAYVDSQEIWSSRRFIAFLIITSFSLFAFFSLLIPIVKSALVQARNGLRQLPLLLKYLLAFVVILLPGSLKWTVPHPENFSIGFWTEFFLMVLAAGFSASLFLNSKSSAFQTVLLAGSFIIAAGAAHTMLLKFNSVTSYPFTLYWSEGNRFFDYSTLFGSQRYLLEGSRKINAFISWGMQLPWALPFIIPNISILLFRFWYQLMWILPTMVLGLVAIHQSRNHHIELWTTLAFSLWTYLFLDQGPIYAPLVIGAILTVIAVRQKLLIGMLLIFIASYYSRSARWTWAYAPGIWAGLLSLLQTIHPSLKKEDWHKLVKPIALGISGYLGGQLIPSIIRMFNSDAAIRLLPNPTASTSRQPLLWDRLYPNPTYPPGILGGLAWAALPLIVFLVSMSITKLWRINWLQKIALVGVTSTFLTIGIIASVKIGGGSNLHNLDMFLISLMLITASALSQVFDQKGHIPNLPRICGFFLLTALIGPVTYGMMGGERISLPAVDKVSESLKTVQNAVEEYSRQGYILFIDHRQLLTFGLVERVPLIDEYEKKYLMDQAMAGNREYFSDFYKDLTSQRFALIVNEPANIIIRGSEYSFGEENDAYVHWVTKPILCTYEPLFTSNETSLQLLIPRQEPPPEEMGCEDVITP